MILNLTFPSGVSMISTEQRRACLWISFFIYVFKSPHPDPLPKGEGTAIVSLLFASNCPAIPALVY
jgi:hypothetical protein